jgi:nucleoside diphosphate kinase
MKELFSTKIVKFVKNTTIMTAVLDKEIVKKALRELINEEPQTFKAILKDILNEQSENSDEQFEKLIQRNFKRFDATFKALA